MGRRRRPSRATAVIAAALVVAGLPSAAPAAGTEVSARDNFFEPQVIRVAPGDRVVWRNRGFASHTVTSDESALFDSGALSPGGTFARTFRKEGEFSYFCRFHGAAGGLGMAGTVIVGEPDEPPEDERPDRLVVPTEFASIQAAVDAAAPGGVVVVKPGIYRESIVVRTPDVAVRGVDRFRTVLHGDDTKDNGIVVSGADRVRIKDLTVRNFAGAGISLTDASDYTVRRVDLVKNRTFGINAVGSFDGVIADSFAYGSGDSAFRVAECFGCSTLIENVKAKSSYFGYAGVNVTGVLVRGSRFVRNGTGAVSYGTGSGEFAPGAATTFRSNVVRANNYETVPAAGISETMGIPFGTGIWLAGTRANVVSANDISDHMRYGVLVTASPDSQWDAVRNRVVGNVVRNSDSDGDASGFDLAWDGSGESDCFSDNDILGATGPPDIQTTFACGKRPFAGHPYEPVMDDVTAALASTERAEADPPEPSRPSCQKGRPGCDR